MSKFKYVEDINGYISVFTNPDSRTKNFLNSKEQNIYVYDRLIIGEFYHISKSHNTYYIMRYDDWIEAKKRSGVNQ